MDGKPNPSGGVGSARLQIFIEVLEIFAHDLSNPLQSLIVLTELALDDATPDSEDALRCEQTLAAAERMRTLVSGLAGLTRTTGGPRRARSSLDRFADVLARRWERHHIELKLELDAAEHAASPPELDVALLNLGLGAIAFANEHEGRYVFLVRGRGSGDDESDRRYALDISLLRHDPDGAPTEVALPTKYLDRARSLVDGSALAIQCSGPRVSLEFSSEAMR